MPANGRAQRHRLHPSVRNLPTQTSQWVDHVNARSGHDRRSMTERCFPGTAASIRTPVRYNTSAARGYQLRTRPGTTPSPSERQCRPPGWGRAHRLATPHGAKPPRGPCPAPIRPSGARSAPHLHSVRTQRTPDTPDDIASPLTANKEIPRNSGLPPGLRDASPRQTRGASAHTLFPTAPCPHERRCFSGDSPQFSPRTGPEDSQ